jgi:hypothetical protein
MENRVPFNPSQFLKDRVRVAPFQHQMLAGGADSFSGGYFTKYASPFALFTKNMTVKLYLERLHGFIKGLSDVMFFYYIANDEQVQYNCGLAKKAEDHEEFSRQFKHKKGLAEERLKKWEILKPIKE